MMIWKIVSEIWEVAGVAVRLAVAMLGEAEEHSQQWEEVGSC